MKTLFSLLCFFLVAGLLSSCEDAAPPAPASATPTFSHVVKFPTEYYLGGPQQARPPDGTFEAGTEVNLLEDSGSYLLVESKGGVQAFVSTSALEPKD
ncbi:MAG: hypothetical protein AAGH89_01780 [Verrucomicrobiota bacterium]